MKKSYIWYGEKPFNFDEIQSIYDKNGKPYASRMLKPRKGLWGSPDDPSAYTWKDWCKSEDFRYPKAFKYHQKFHLKNGARVAYLNTKASVFKFVSLYFEPYVSEVIKTACDDTSSKYELLKMIDNPNSYWDFFELSLASEGFGICMERLVKDYDAIEINHKHNWGLIHGIFNTWDCDSICVINKNVIELEI